MCGESRMPSSGWSTTFFSASNAMALNYSGVIGESLAYQPTTGQVVVSNIITNSDTVALPFSASINGQTVQYSYGPNGALDGVLKSSAAYGTFGTLADAFDDTLMWSAIGLFPPTAGCVCAIIQWNSSNGEILQYYNFTSFSQPTGCLADDLIIANNGVENTFAYVTDFFGYQVSTRYIRL